MSKQSVAAALVGAAVVLASAGPQSAQAQVAGESKELPVKEKKATAARKETPGFGGKAGVGMLGVQMSLEVFVEKGTASVVAQLAGTLKGFVPLSMNLGLPEGDKGSGGTGGFGIGQFLAPALLKEIDTNGDKKLSPKEMEAWVKKLFKENDKDGKGLDEKTLAAVLAKLLPAMAGFVGGKGLPGGFDPALTMTRQLMTKIDPDGKGIVTQDKMLAAVAKYAKEWDKDKNGTLDEAELAEGLNQLLGTPAGQGGVQKLPPEPGKKDGKQ